MLRKGKSWKKVVKARRRIWRMVGRVKNRSWRQVGKVRKVEKKRNRGWRRVVKEVGMHLELPCLDQMLVKRSVSKKMRLVVGW